MLRAFIETRADGEFFNTEAFSAFEGFIAKGYQINKSYYPCLSNDLTKNDIAFGSVRFVKDFIDKIGIKQPEPIDYPEELRYKYLGRKVSSCSLADFRTANYGSDPVFVKPYQHKLFHGFIMNPDDFERNPINIVRTPIWDLPGSTLIWVSEFVDFVSEWRAFVHNGRVIDVRNYTGPWHIVPDYNIVMNAVADYMSSPIAYSLDFGITNEGETLLVEANDCYALGSYGLDNYNYTNMIEARWIEITNQ